MKTESKYGEMWRRFRKSPTAVLGLIILVILILVAIFADVIADKELVTAIDVHNRCAGLSSEHPFGTDDFGRDVFARLVHGSRYSLSIGLIGAAFSMLIGAILGATAGYYGGAFDTLLMRAIDTVTSIPSILLCLCLVTAFGQSLTNLILAISIARIPFDARTVRSVVLTVVDSQYVEAARAGGERDMAIIFKHIIPNVSSTIIVGLTTGMGQLILRASGLSFLGLGVPTPAPEWGTMLSDAKTYMTDAPHMMIFPGMALVLTALSINLVGDGIRDMLDPRLKS